MGCVASRIEKVERVQVCKQRKKTMKQLVGFRADFAEAQLAYLKALKNTGVTLRQFTESESLDFDSVSVSATETFAPPPPPPPASPPMPLPPSPPPPPPLSPDSRKTTDEEEDEEEGEIEECVSPPMPGSVWAPWDPFQSEEAEDWAETKTEFEGEEEEEEEEKGVEKCEAVSEKAKRAVVMWRGEGIRRRRKESLESVVKELDDHFLRASAGVKEITVIMDLNGSHGLLPHGLCHVNAGKKGNTAKVFSALSWNRSSKSLQFSRDSVDSGAGISEPCRPGAHCVTLNKFLEEEQKLYKDVKEEEIVKQEHERKSSLLQKQDNENHDSTKTEKIRSSVENLEADLMRLRESISRTCLSILNSVDDELYPQIVAITSGLLQMWRTMQESHEAQYKISQLLTHLSDDQKMDPSTAYHRQAAVELKAEVNRWYDSFCQVASSQKDYVRTLSRWLRLTDGLKEDGRHSLHSAAVARLCHKWLSSLERLPDKATSEAIKGLCSAVQAIVVQQEEEHSLQRKYEKAERRLHRELESLTEMEMKLEGVSGDESSGLSPKHPLVLKRAKAEALKRHSEAEKATYFKSVQATKALTLNDLRTNLPGVFKALADFSRGSVEAIDALFTHVKPEEEDSSETPHTE